MSTFESYLNKVKKKNYNETFLLATAAKLAGSVIKKGKELAKNAIADLDSVDSDTVRKFKEAFVETDFGNGKNLKIESTLDGVFAKGWMSKKEFDVIASNIGLFKKEIYQKRGYAILAGLFKNIVNKDMNLIGYDNFRDARVNLADNGILKANADWLVKTIKSLNKRDSEMKQDFNRQEK